MTNYRFQFSKEKISHLTNFYVLTNETKIMIFFSFQKTTKKSKLKMPEATNIAASSTESFPGYSVLDGQYELHETGNFYFLEKLLYNINIS